MKNKDLFVIGIGASAGGLDAIQKLFDNMPAETGLAFVIVQHLSPNFKSLMPELLAKHTKIPIYTATHDQLIEPNSIYLNQRGKDLKIKDGRLQLSDKEPRHHLSLPIDTFFHSLGLEYKENSVGVVLSGTGTDSSRGIKTIKEEGGTIIVQEPSSAQFNGMPNAAISTNLPDYILSPGEMADIISEIPNKRFFTDTENSSQTTNEKAFVEILKEIHKSSGIDFSGYKRSTLLRRLEKRMGINNIHTLEKYLGFIKENANEGEQIKRDFLIQVTSFFRDFEAFEKLKKEIVPNIIDSVSEHETIRIWVAACSTGEEAFSLAIIFDDVISSMKKNVDFKIFATDVAYRGAERDGYGTYNMNVSSEIPEKYLEKYFIKSQDKLLIVKKIREKILFSKHNIIKDPPFNRMDLISCRNFLIYLDSELQKRVLTNFHYGLKQNGFLFLGISESLGSLSTEFESVNPKYKIFRNVSEKKKLPNIEIPKQRGTVHEFLPLNTVNQEIQSTSGNKNNESFFHHLLSKKYSPDCVIFDKEFNVLYIKGEAGRRLAHKEGVFKNNLLRMVNEDISFLIRNTVKKLGQNSNDILIKDVLIKTEDEEFVTDLLFSLPGGSASQYYLLSFGEKEDPAKSAEVIQSSQLKFSNTANDRIKELEDELTQNKSNLQDAVEELETSNEELQSSNEELMASNEELQSTNEELQSVNEELHTVNAELQERNSELKRLNDDMTNILNSSNVATLFLDSELKIRKFTPAMKKLFNLTKDDIQRSINDFASIFNDSIRKSIITDSKIAISEFKTFEKEIQDENGTYYLKKINPYISADKKVEGVVITFTDISTLKKHEKLKAESDTRYHELFENLNEAFIRGRIIKDKNGNPVDWEYIDVNSAFEAELGRSVSEVEGKRISEIIPGEDITEWLERYAETAETGDKKTITDYAPPLKGFYAVHVFSPRKGEFAATYADLTHIRETEESLRISNNRFELASNITGLAFWEWNLKYNSGSGNINWERLFGIGSKNFLSQFTGNIRGSKREKVIAELNKHINGETGRFQQEFRYYNPVNGKYLWVNMVSKVLKTGENGKPEKLICAGLDITEKKQTIVNLQREKLFNQKISESVPGGIYTYNIQMNQFTFVNEYFTKISGYQLEELNIEETAHLLHYCHPDDYKALKKHFENVIKKEKQLSTEFRLKHKRGRWIWCMALHSPLERDNNNKVISLVGVLISISHRKKMDAQLINAKKKAELANMHKNIFLANMSHEIRTPMNSVIGFSRMLKNDRLDIATRNEYLHIIDKSSNQLLGLIDDVIDVAKMEAGELKVMKNPFNLDEMLKSLEVTFNHAIEEAGKKNLSLILELPDKKIPTLIETDERRVKQVLSNLLGNAIKFTENGKIKFGYTWNKKQIDFYVSDEGIGIPRNKLNEIFETFKQVNYNPAKYGGTGLGLAISKGIVDLLGGEISVKSKVRKGTTFSFSIPYKPIVSEKTGEEITPYTSDGHNLKGRKILIAEDDNFIRMHFQALFKPTGAKVTFAPDGEEAVKIFKEQPDFDFILMDIRMPKKNGYQAMEEILGINPNAIIIMQSAFAMQEEVEKCYKAGCKGYLTKPVDSEELFSLIKKLEKK